MQGPEEAAPAQAGEGAPHGGAHAASPMHKPVTLVIRVAGAAPGQVRMRARAHTPSYVLDSWLGHPAASASCILQARLLSALLGVMAALTGALCFTAQRVWYPAHAVLPGAAVTACWRAAGGWQRE